MKKVFLQSLCFSLLLVTVMLPKDAVLLTRGEPGKEWVQTGLMECSVMAAVRQWESVLGHQGWRETDRMKLNANRYLSVWERSGKKITLLIWEKEIGKSGFSWGELTESKKK